MTRIIAVFLLAALSLLALTRPPRTSGALPGRAAGRRAWLEEVRRLRLSELRRTILTSRRRNPAAGDAQPTPAAAPIRRARVRRAELRDGVLGFVCGLILVTVVLCAAVALAAQPLR